MGGRAGTCLQLSWYGLQGSFEQGNQRLGGFLWRISIAGQARLQLLKYVRLQVQLAALLQESVHMHAATCMCQYMSPSKCTTFAKKATAKTRNSDAIDMILDMGHACF